MTWFPDVFISSKMMCFFPVEKAPEKNLVKMMVSIGESFFWLVVVVRKFREQRSGLKVHSTKKKVFKVFLRMFCQTLLVCKRTNPCNSGVCRLIPIFPVSFESQVLLNQFEWHLEFHQISGGRSVNPIRSKAYLQRTPHHPLPPPVFSIPMGQKFYFKKIKSLRSKLFGLQTVRPNFHGRNETKSPSNPM